VIFFFLFFFSFDGLSFMSFVEGGIIYILFFIYLFFILCYNSVCCRYRACVVACQLDANLLILEYCSD
jgi:hypothetical protein